MRRRVSGETPTLNSDGVKEVMVRQVPFMLILSPKWASARMSAHLEIVREVPPPPAAVSSWASRAVTAGYVRGFSGEGIRQDGGCTAYGFNYAGEHDRQASSCV